MNYKEKTVLQWTPKFVSRNKDNQPIFNVFITNARTGNEVDHLTICLNSSFLTSKSDHEILLGWVKNKMNKMFGKDGYVFAGYMDSYYKYWVNYSEKEMKEKRYL